MSSRLSRIMRHIGPNPLFAAGRKPRLLPMSAEDERLQAEINRRREQRRKDRETRP